MSKYGNFVILLFVFTDMIFQLTTAMEIIDLIDQNKIKVIIAMFLGVNYQRRWFKFEIELPSNSGNKVLHGGHI